jgi:hypothetical protein
LPVWHLTAGAAGASAPLPTHAPEHPGSARRTPGLRGGPRRVNTPDGWPLCGLTQAPWGLGESQTLGVVLPKWRAVERDGPRGLVSTASQSQEGPMPCITVRGPHWGRAQIVTRGTTARGTQRSLCPNTRGAKASVLLDYGHRGCVPEVKHPRIAMRLNAPPCCVHSRSKKRRWRSNMAKTSVTWMRK